MPLYLYTCPKCGQQRTDIRLIAERHDGPMCYVCKAMQMKLQVAPPMVIVKDPAVPRSKP